jgi:hypothetical protein
MDQIRITNTDPSDNASFDVGEIQFSSTTTTVGADNVEVGSKVNIVDDAPSIQAVGALPLMQVDETNFLVDDTEVLSGLFTISGGSDTATSNLTLVATTGVATGLVATGTNTAITLVQSSPTLVQGVDGSGNVIFDVSITSGVLKLDQKLAIKHPTTDPNESINIASELCRVRSPTRTAIRLDRSASASRISSPSSMTGRPSTKPSQVAALPTPQVAR